jgi:hypothetical protein
MPPRRYQSKKEKRKVNIGVFINMNIYEHVAPLACSRVRYELTLNYHMTMEGYPNPNERVGSSIPNCEFFSLLDGKNKIPPIAR